MNIQSAVKEKEKKLLIACDSKLMLDLLEFYLREVFSAISPISDLSKVENGVKEHSPDMVIMLFSDKSSAFKIAQKIAFKHPEMKVVLMVKSAERLVEAFKNGISLLTEDNGAESLVLSIDYAFRGIKLIDPHMSSALFIDLITSGKWKFFES